MEFFTATEPNEVVDMDNLNEGEVEDSTVIEEDDDDNLEDDDEVEEVEGEEVEDAD